MARWRQYDSDALGLARRRVALHTAQSESLSRKLAGHERELRDARGELRRTTAAAEQAAASAAASERHLASVQSDLDECSEASKHSRVLLSRLRVESAKLRAQAQLAQEAGQVSERVVGLCRVSYFLDLLVCLYYCGVASFCLFE